MNTFTTIFSIIAMATNYGCDKIEVWGTGPTTRIRGTQQGLDPVTKTVESPLPFVSLDIQQALEIEDWQVTRTGHGFTATRDAA